MLLLIDNYDSFTYNLVQYFSLLGETVEVFRNDATDCTAIKEKKPDYLVIGPGPSNPKEAGISIQVVQAFAGKIPLLGVCLGLQSIGEAFGGKTVPAKSLMHGKASLIYHQGSDLFTGLKNPVSCIRYHSLVTDRAALPACLHITAHTEDDEIMALRHRDFPIFAVQFHPEAFMTEGGMDMLANFLQQNQPVGKNNR